MHVLLTSQDMAIRYSAASSWKKGDKILQKFVLPAASLGQPALQVAGRALDVWEKPQITCTVLPRNLEFWE